ncbi:hypothetical protein CAI21_01665 [Alkalilimnicola ehrlichii]|uniref:HDOD domain-containing protein n=1 Tax=Alkalilimnicola ehrlichii TaxID=351052 RepID=A0A3E0X1U1_9GAMM|nr:HDOD domain-containing protein [Alkalilimnicola ehrlichii]RFA31357.1 hypothetical protein CAI21_01665 [Alkalilimnicola ehrlichii]RFA39629.1 hypothetical protein CAL65_00745 [Alkalilimnicola ehrlichii]
MSQSAPTQLVTLPALPYVAHEILLKINNHEPSISHVAAALGQEPSVTARVIAMANSAYFAQQRPTYSLEEAITRLGLNRVRVMAVSTLLAQQFDPTKCPSFHAEQYWRNAVSAAFTATRLGREVALGPDADAAYLAGLLHNIGMLLLVCVEPEAMSRVFSAHRRYPERSLSQHCHDELGYDHHAAGHLLLREWQLPEAVVTVVGAFRDPDYQGPHKRLVQLIRLSVTWVEAEFLVRPDNSAFPELSTHRLQRIGKDCLREQEHLEALTRLLAGGA